MNTNSYSFPLELVRLSAEGRGKVLICPLNWGLGHATRCVPIIRKLITDGHQIVLVGDGYPLQFLKLEFPTLRTIELPSYYIKYSAGKSQIGAMIISFPRVIFGAIKEHFWLKKFLQKEHFDQIISDNRFGMWCNKVHSIYITHQLMVKMPKGLKFMESFVHSIHKAIIVQYDECWIPDCKENGALSGDLSHKYTLPDNATFIGTLSRFQGMESTIPSTEYEVVAIISGVEPQRTLFEESIIEKYQNSNCKVLIIRGQPQREKEETHINNITLTSHLSSLEIVSKLLGAKEIISRSGYSTIMDLDALNCLHKAVFIPTPGQTEQEYLFSIHTSQLIGHN